MEEILAHVSAPVTREDDERYRSQAAAYLKFESMPHHYMPPSSPRRQVTSTTILSNQGKGNTGILNTVEDGPRSANHSADILFAQRSRCEEESSYAPSPSSRSVLEQLRIIERTSISNLAARAPANPASYGSEEHLEYAEDTQAAIEMIDSQLLTASFGTQSSLGSVDEEYLNSSTRENAPDAPSEEVMAADSNADQTPARHDLDHQAVYEDLTSQLPLSYGISTRDFGSITLAPSNSSQVQLTRQTSPVAPNGICGATKQQERQSYSSFTKEAIIIHAPDLASSDRETAPEPAKPSETETVNGSPTMTVPLGSSSNGSSAHEKMTILSQGQSQRDMNHAPSANGYTGARVGTEEYVLTPERPSKQPSYDFGKIPVRVYTPLPPTAVEVACDPWSVEVPSRLRVLMEKTGAAVYQPSALDPTIDMTVPGLRGYWTFETSSWDPKTQYQFWIEMSDFVIKGYGSSMRMRRGRVEGAVDDETCPSDGLGRIDVWCWACLAEHVYHLIYVLSKSKVKHTDAKWYTGSKNRLAIEIVAK